MPDDDFVKRCFRKVFLVFIFPWPYRELSEWLLCGSCSINAILVDKVFDFFPLEENSYIVGVCETSVCQDIVCPDFLWRRKRTRAHFVVTCDEESYLQEICNKRMTYTTSCNCREIFQVMLSQDMGDSYTLHHNEQGQPSNQTLKNTIFRTSDFFVLRPSEIILKNEGWGATLDRRLKNLVSELRYAQDCIQ